MWYIWNLNFECHPADNCLGWFLVQLSVDTATSFACTEIETPSPLPASQLRALIKKNILVFSSYTYTRSIISWVARCGFYDYRISSNEYNFFLQFLRFSWWTPRTLAFPLDLFIVWQNKFHYFRKEFSVSCALTTIYLFFFWSGSHHQLANLV